MHSEIYKRIRDNIIRTWPAWKRKIYNSCFAVSAHAEKLPEDDRTRSTPVWTNYDRLVSMTPREMASWFAKILDHCENKMPAELCRQSCPLYKCCNDQPSDNIEDWLKAKAEGK